MAEYKEIHGTKIRNYTTNPDNPIVGEVWYNETDQVLKFLANNVTTAGAWSTAANMNTARARLGGAGTSTSMLVYGGYLGPSGDTNKTETESFNGSSWTEVNDLNLKRGQLSGAGASNTSSLAFAGTDAPPFNNVKTETESWNGSNWTEVNNLNTGRRRGGGFGIATAAILAGGANSGGTNVAVTEYYNGTNWTEMNDLNQAGLLEGNGIGEYTAGLAVGRSTSPSAVTESWNGTNWTEVADLNTGRFSGSGFGTQTSGLYAAGNPLRSIAEEWNGSSWTEVADLSTAREAFAAGGTVPSGIVAGGGTSAPNLSATEIWTGAGAPAGAWSTGTNINNTRNYIVGIGTYTSALAVGGTPPDGSYSAENETWNGTNWTEVNNVNTGRFGATGAGVSNTSGLIMFGYTGPPPSTANSVLTESWNGTNWTEVNDANTKRQDGGGFGTQTSALVAGGYKYVSPPGRSALTESWNGTNWTEVNDLNEVRYKLSESGAGADNTSGIIAGGDAPGGDTTKTELWNGTNWTEVNDMNLVRDNLGACGIATAALAFGGEEDAPGGDSFYAQTEEWNGTSWTEVNDLNSGRTRVGSAGTTANALCIAGNPGTGIVASTEEWSKPSTSTKTVGTD